MKGAIGVWLRANSSSQASPQVRGGGRAEEIATGNFGEFLFPGSRVNQGSRNPDSCAPTAPALLHLALELSVSLAYDIALYATTSPAVTWGGFGLK